MTRRARGGRQLAIVAVTALVASVTWIAPARAGTFDDVPEGVWFETPVEWLVSVGITNGTSDTTFSPGENVTRAQMAAFLARFGDYRADSPESGFADVPDGVFYDAPVDWLVEHAITTGTSATTYSPGLNVTRAQMAAFLWRFAGREPATGGTPFVDVPEGQWYSEAVAWLLENEITEGTSATTFSPNANVTRAQMAAFLWRLASRPDPGDAGVNRVAALPLPASGGEFVEGDVLVTFGGLSGDGFVKVVAGEGAGQLASLDGAVSDDIEIVVSQATFNGPITVTVPIETVELDEVDLVVFVLDETGEWGELAIEVTAEVIDGQTFATFTLPAEVALAPSARGDLSLLAAGEAERIVTRVAKRDVPPPSTSTTITTSPTSSTTTIPVDPIVLDLSAWASQLVETAPVGSSLVGASGGSGTFVDVRAVGLPPGLELTPTLIGTIPLFGVVTGAPTGVGTYFVTLEVEDDLGNVGTAIASVEVIPNGQEAAMFSTPANIHGNYPTVSPSGRTMAVSTSSSPDRFAVVDIGTGEIEFEAEAHLLNTLPGSVVLSADDRYATFSRGDGIVQADVITGVETLVAADVNYSQIPAVSDDGRFVAFASASITIVPEPEPISFNLDVFIWDRETLSTERITPGEGDSFVSWPAESQISKDGRFLLVRSSEDLADDGDGPGVFLYDRIVGNFDRAGDVFGSRVALSGDGSTVYTLWNGRLERWDRTSGATTTVLAAGVDDSGDAPMVVSDGGRFVAFATNTALVAGDEPFTDDIYQWDAIDLAFRQATAGEATNDERAFDMSNDGETIVFRSTADDLTPDPDANGTGFFTGHDAFLWNRRTGVIERITGSTFPVVDTIDISDDGSTVMFTRPLGGAGRAYAFDRSASVPADSAAVCPNPVRDVLRSHVMVNLWRDAGSPSPTTLGSERFDDVPAGSPYDAAAGWAFEQGITAGTSGSTFSPDGVVTRSQYVVFLHRAEGTPTPVGPNPWTDVADGSFFEDAAIWAADEALPGIGATTFGPSVVMTHAGAAEWWAVLDPTFNSYACAAYEVG